MLELGVVVGAIGLSVVAWRRFGAAYGLYGLTVIAVPLTFPAEGRPLLSMTRFVLVAFPAFMALAAIVTRRWAHLAICAAFAAGLAVVVVQMGVVGVGGVSEGSPETEPVIRDASTAVPMNGSQDPGSGFPRGRPTGGAFSSAP